MNKCLNHLKIRYLKLKPYFYLTNFFVFIAKIILGLCTGSFSFFISSLYNLGIGFTKKKIYGKNNNFTHVGLFLMLASISFIVYSIWSIVTHKKVSYNLYMSITIATLTFYDIGHSIYGFLKEKKHRNYENKLLMLINLATALISLELTQSALLSFMQLGIDNSLYNGLVGILTGFISFFIGFIIYKKIRQYNQN